MMRYPISEAETVQAMALSIMILAWIQLNLTTNSSHLESIENILRMLSTLFGITGEPMFLSSLRIIWFCATNALIQCERTHFPGLPLQTPSHLILPRTTVGFHSLSPADWATVEPLLLPAEEALQAFNDWVWTVYDHDIHQDVDYILKDALILIGMAISIAGTRLEV